MTLFDQPSTEARANHTDTSRQAARKAAPQAGTIRDAIMAVMAQDPCEPVCTSDIARMISRSHDSIKARVNELHEQGRISCLEHRGTGKHGWPVKLYVVAGHEQGRRTEPYRKGVRAAAAQDKIDRLRTQIRMLGHVPCV